MYFRLIETAALSIIQPSWQLDNQYYYGFEIVRKVYSQEVWPAFLIR